MPERLDDSDRPKHRLKSDEKEMVNRMLKDYGRLLDGQKTDTFKAKNLLTNIKSEINNRVRDER